MPCTCCGTTSNADEEEAAEEREYEEIAGSRSGRRATLISFGVLFTAKWGDLSQLFTAGLVVCTGAPVEVFLGAWMALVLVAGLAVTLGRTLVRKVSLTVVAASPVPCSP